MANPKPISEVRIGRVKAAIWPNGTEGRTRHNVTFSRLYKTAMNGRARRASVATTCCCLPKWPIRPTRVSSSFSRQKSLRQNPSATRIRERRGNPRRDPILSTRRMNMNCIVSEVSQAFLAAAEK